MPRISSTSFFNNNITNIRHSYEKLVKLQNQVQTQKAMERPSDNPIRANQAILLESNLKEIQQYLSNTQNGSDELTYADQMLDTLMVPLNNAISKVQQGLNDANAGGTPAYSAIAAEIDSVLNTFMSIGNTQLAGKNIFGGSYQSGQVFQTLGSDILFNGNNDDNSINVGLNDLMPVNMKSRDIFGAAATILDSDKNLNMRIPELSLESDIPVKEPLSETLLRQELRLTAMKKLSELNIAPGTLSGGLSSHFDSNISVASMGEFLDGVRDSLHNTGTITIDFSDQSKAKELESVLNEVKQIYLKNTTNITLQTGQHINTSRLTVTIDESNNKDSKAIIDAINNSALQLSTTNSTFSSTNKEINAKIAALSAFEKEISKFAGLTNTLDLSSTVFTLTSSEIFSTEIQTVASAAFGAGLTYSGLNSDQRQVVDAATNAAKNSFSSSEFKAIQTRSGISIAHENEELIRIDRGMSDSAVVHALELGNQNNGSIYTIDSDLQGASINNNINADQTIKLKADNGNFIEVDLFNNDTIAIVAQRINRAVNLAHVDSSLRTIVAREDKINGQLALSSENFFTLETNAGNDIVDQAAKVHSALHGQSQAIDDLHNGAGLTIGTQKILANNTTTGFDSTITIQKGDSFEYVLQQLNDLAGFQAVLNDSKDGIKLTNITKFALDTSSLPTSPLTITNSDGFSQTITLSADPSTITQEINAVSSTNFIFNAEVNSNGTGIIISSNENFSIIDGALPPTTISATDLSSLNLIDSDIVTSLGLNHNEVIPDEIKSGEIYTPGLIKGSSLINRQVRLSELNNGDGVTKGKLFISMGTTTAEVDLSAADNLRDVKFLMEEAFPNQFDVEINEHGNGLAIISKNNSPITIREANGGAIARHLGLIEPPATSATGLNIQGSDIDPVFSGQTRLKDLNGGHGIDTTGFVIRNGSRSATITFDSDGDGRDDIRNMTQLVNHINQKSKENEVYIEASLDTEDGGLTITSKLSNTTLEITEKRTENTSYTTIISTADLATGVGNGINIISQNGTQISTDFTSLLANNVVSDINAIAEASTTNFGIKAFVNRDGNVEILSRERISVSDTDTSFTTSKLIPNPPVMGSTAADLGLLGAFSGETLLSTLNDGSGIEHGSFEIKYGSDTTPGMFNINAKTVTVDIEFAETLSDVKNAIEKASNNDISVSFGHSNRIELTLASHDDSQRIEISETSGTSDVAHSLGLIHPSVVMGRELKDGSQDILTASTSLESLGWNQQTYQKILIEVSGNLDVLIDMSSANTIGDVISLINSTTSAQSGDPVNIEANIVNGRYLSISEKNGNTLKVISTSAISNAIDPSRNTINGLSELLGLGMNPLLSGEAHFISTDLQPMHQAENFFSALTNLRDEFETGNLNQSVTSNSLIRLESLRDKLLIARGEAGGRIVRLNSLTTRYEDESVKIQSLYGSKVEVDFLEVTQQYLQQQQVYEAGLSVTSRIVGNSLFNYL